MAVVSVRLNKDEEKSLYEMYEDIQDIKFIENYIEKSNVKEREFVSGDDLFS